MTFPTDWTKVPVHGTYLARDGSPASGRVIFAAQQVVCDPANLAVVLPADVICTLDITGSFTVQLPATDDPQTTPTGWAYQVIEQTNSPNNRAPFQIFVPYDTVGTLEMSTIAPVVPPQELVSTKGPPGERGADGQGFALSGSVATYADLPDDLTSEDRGQAWLVNADHSVYTWSGSAWPADGEGADIVGPAGAKGDKGDPGDPGTPGTDGTDGTDGDPGPANTLTIGTVTTLAAGSQATADITGTAPNQTLDLGIPKGDKGDAGSGGSTVETVVAGTGINVDATDPANPVVALNSATQTSLGKADTATQPGTTLAHYGITDAATAAQGALADTAVQPGDLGTAAAHAATDFDAAGAAASALTTAESYTDTQVATKLAKSANLSDVANAATALGNLGGEPAITGGTSAQYIRGDKTLGTFAAAVLAVVLTGLSTATNAAITATDSVLVAMGKLQAQITANIAALATKATDRSTVTALTNSSGTVNVDCSLGDYFTLLVAANVTSLTFSNLPASGVGRAICIDLSQDGTGSRTFALPASFKAIGNSDTAIQSAASAKTRIVATTTDGGTTWPYSMGKIAA